MLSSQVVKAALKKLRQGPALGHPTAVLDLGQDIREHLRPQGVRVGSHEEVQHLVAVLRSAVTRLSVDERIYAEADLNMAKAHRFPTLTERQESLATVQKCALKTVRRRAEHALDTLAFQLLAGGPDRAEPLGTAERPDTNTSQPNSIAGFWKLGPSTRVDIVCSEIPEQERPYFASSKDRNYLRYAKFADLDTLIYLRSRFAQLAPAATVRDFAPSEYYDNRADILVVAGGPPWNATYREFLPHLPFHFKPNPLGEDDPLVVPTLDNLTMGPRWTEHQELLEDLAVFSRLTLAHGTTVFLLGGCLTLGVLGAAHALLEGERGARSVAYVERKVGADDFVLVTETRRVGAFTDVADLTAEPPLLLLSRRNNNPFSVVEDNTARYLLGRTGSAPNP
ncbi:MULTISPECIES: hypothetical protein [unclassified Crossiella]|uniref:hypothetical protein n=1 Tax=unclassified Crossiella TaxID=2620835 RepID=UPI001FFF50E6|nr:MULTISPECIES: hypothetical protein [unclassified Crossiella]MCK2237414.1 hypothetical protein [Crossiella sp. S99.2]MCK2251069.1 hypothetical protein [Crossiella sp. S99.1]